MSCFSRVEGKVKMATYSKVSIGKYVTKMMFSTFSPCISCACSIIRWQHLLVLLKWWILL